MRVAGNRCFPLMTETPPPEIVIDLEDVWFRFDGGPPVLEAATLIGAAVYFGHPAMAGALVTALAAALVLG